LTGNSPCTAAQETPAITLFMASESLDVADVYMAESMVEYHKQRLVKDEETATKKFIGDCAIKYEFVDVDMLKGDERKAIIEDVKKFNPRCSFPTIIIGEKVIVGYKEKEIKEALGM